MFRQGIGCSIAVVKKKTFLKLFPQNIAEIVFPLCLVRTTSVKIKILLPLVSRRLIVKQDTVMYNIKVESRN